jgi:S1-C subfamily serine protease
VAPTASAAPSASAAPTATAAPSERPRDAGELTETEIFKRFAPAVLTVDVKTQRGQGNGTAFMLDKQGTLATNFHVIDDATSLRIRAMNGASYEEVWVLATDAAVDLALLQVDAASPKEGDAPRFEPVALGDSDAVVVGERAVSIGNPLGLEHTLTTGIVSSRRTFKGRPWIQMSTPISPGNSGGPVFNGRGEVVGVTTASLSTYGIGENLNLAVPINELKRLVKPDYPGKRKFGSGGSPSRW